MFSYWEQESFSRYDHIVIGAGIVGLSHTVELKERFPHARVLVLERALLPTGASTRNAGFACMGSATELLDDLQHDSEENVVALFAARKRGLEKLRARLGDEAIGYAAEGSHELISERELPALDKLDHLNRLLQPVTGKPAFRIASEHTQDLGLDTGYVKALIENTCEGALHTGKMMRTLTDLAIGLGIEIKTGAEVIRFDEESTHVTVVAKDPFRHAEWPLRCSTMSICTNAFTRQLLPDQDVVPGRGQVLVTDPIPALKLKGIFHFDMGYYYFRELNGRVLFGGGRNLAFQQECTTEIALNEQIQADLDHKLANIILPGTPFRVAQRWAGIMAFGATKTPIVRAFSDRVYGAFRMGGMGVALGSNAAEELAIIIENTNCR